MLAVGDGGGPGIPGRIPAILAKSKVDMAKSMRIMVATFVSTKN
jgi:hypothetical protein